MSSTKVLALCAAPERQRLKPGRIMRMDVKQMANLLSRRSLVLSGLASAVLANTTARAAELLTFVSPFEAGSARSVRADRRTRNRKAAWPHDRRREQTGCWRQYRGGICCT